LENDAKQILTIYGVDMCAYGMDVCAYGVDMCAYGVDMCAGFIWLWTERGGMNTVINFRIL
jgi:hypothetical protein